MIKYLSKQEADIYIQINIFNDVVNMLVEPTIIDSTSITKIIDLINEISPDGSTNIGLALKTAEDDLQKYKKNFPNHQYGHIFMSDGDPTIGERKHDVLQNMINSDFINIFVGFGLSHNASLFSKFSEIRNTEYQFVDNLENTGLVYGETIHRFLYPAIKSVKITIDNGLLYNWRTNTWVSYLEDSVLVSETEKLYQFKTNSPDSVEMGLYGIICSLPHLCELDFDINQDSVELIETTFPFPNLMDENGVSVDVVDLTKYMFRQRVQELLYNSRNLNTRECRTTRSDIKGYLKDIFRKMRKYMRENQLENDPFMNLLCDDISITYKTLGTIAGLLYTASRQTSQGRQTAYTASAIPNINDDCDMFSFTPRKKVQRTKTGIFGQMPTNFDPVSIPVIEQKEDTLFLDDKKPRPSLSINTNDDTSDIDIDGFLSEDEIEGYKTSEKNNITCYSTPTALKVMRDISQPRDDVF
jgi:hypothetical protein